VLAKVLAVLAGIAAVASFFLPLVTVDLRAGDREVRYGVSAWRLVRGSPEVSEEGLTPEEARDASRDAESRLGDVSREVLLLWIPSGVLALVGLWALLARYGRLPAVFALLAGAAAAGVWFLLREEFLDRPDPPTEGLGLWSLAVAGGAGFLSGLVGLFAPERRRPGGAPPVDPFRP
jgi:hypothetical protein